uniref:Uncharacterized protein n=1 Tax=Marseillevirus LCMAC201 TaxID=2506605 RepID=A0A481YWH6_9VIRU|nr:MAG: hypothetical protein LCMAC201_03890 [Marseillevirus LCMAC201]
MIGSVATDKGVQTSGLAEPDFDGRLYVPGGPTLA